MSNNTNLNAAGIAKEDEFYTKLEDIEKELFRYAEYFRGKVVFCNCDDPYESNFFKYFALKFNELGLKKLIATCYDGSPFAGQQLNLFDLLEKTEDNRKAFKIEVTEVDDINGDGAVDLFDVQTLLKNKKNVLTKLKENGDFRSEECIELLKQADIVCTNPPFSLFRQYIAQLMEYKKDFLILGNQNNITYKEVFPLIQNNKLWLGYHSGSQEFFVPDDFVKNNVYVDKNGRRMAKFGNICWFTNLPVAKRNEEIVLWETFSPEKYHSFDNYEGINVDSVAHIPCDYYGIMGVPITFLTNYNPNQFEILGITDRQNSSGLRTKVYTKEDSPKFNDLNARSVIKVNGEYIAKYARILIRRK